ncbi:MAG: hypothetical protein VCC00_02590 [Deltaproteobacteria bacterium]
MARAKKKTTKGGATKKESFSLWGDSQKSRQDAAEAMPKDEAGRLKIKRQYEELLEIRVAKLAGRILNRERIDKESEGIYFICVACKKICHNLDEGLIEDEDNKNNICLPCSEAPTKGRKSSRK